uniref:Retrovirus-related Pol polyprotein from transposon TNT 1-94 n=1 Tax=Cajanus cajan TaxID=3821 RepID=A0A151TH65_CAJCA|nr:hypothetical protein KK1_012692 [Cajanus cajan]
MFEAKAISSPLVSNCKLSKNGSDVLQDDTIYRSVVGALQYVTLTRPEISFAVNKACQFMAKPLKSHWTAVKRILHYLKGTLHNGLNQPFTLQTLCDADCTADLEDRRSTSGAAVFLAPNLISWRSSKQPIVARSSTEA